MNKPNSPCQLWYYTYRISTLDRGDGPNTEQRVKLCWPGPSNHRAVLWLGIGHAKYRAHLATSS